MPCFIHSSTVLQPSVGPWPLLQFRNLFYTDARTPWMSDQLVARPLPAHRTTQTQNKRIHRHPCLEWDSNSRSQCLSWEDSSCGATAVGSALFNCVFYMFMMMNAFNKAHKDCYRTANEENELKQCIITFHSSVVCIYLEVRKIYFEVVCRLQCSSTIQGHYIMRAECQVVSPIAFSQYAGCWECQNC
jgi:hypothetical protein